MLEVLHHKTAPVSEQKRERVVEKDILYLIKYVICIYNCIFIIYMSSYNIRTFLDILYINIYVHILGSYIMSSYCIMLDA